MNPADHAKAFIQSLPNTFSTLNHEMRLVLEQYCKDWLQRMEVVTREEFDIQAQVLQKTRAKLEALEKQLNDVLQHTS